MPNPINEQNDARTHDHQQRSSTEVFSIAETADYINGTPAQLAMMRTRGTGPRYSKLSARLIVYRREDVDEWIASKLRTSTREDVS